VHTGGASQEGNLVGIAKESHTDLPYLPSSTIRGRLRADTSKESQKLLWGNTIEHVTKGEDNNLTQGALWVGDASILWFPISSLSHGVVWVSSPLLLRRWLRLTRHNISLPSIGSFSGGNKSSLYLKDAIFKANSSELKPWEGSWADFLPPGGRETETITQVLILSDKDCRILIEMSLWRQVRVNLDDQKSADAFRYEEAIPPETLMFFPWGTTTTFNQEQQEIASQHFCKMIENSMIQQLGGQESLGRGLVDLWIVNAQHADPSSQKIQEQPVL